ncbi:hypothetical protein E4T56_gene4221, partial [Termitomyces sp. T112]
LPLAIAAGLVLGKPIGVFGAIGLAEAFGFARRPEGHAGLFPRSFAGKCDPHGHSGRVADIRPAGRHAAAAGAARLMPAAPLLPSAGVGHAGPGFLRVQPAVLQQFDADAVGGFDKGHMPVAGRTVNGHPGIGQRLTGGIDILDLKRQMAEIAPAGVSLGAAILGGPVIGQFDLIILTGAGQIDQRETALLAGKTAGFLKAQQGEDGDGGVGIGHADHRMQELRHDSKLHSSPVLCRPSR